MIPIISFILGRKFASFQWRCLISRVAKFLCPCRRQRFLRWILIGLVATTNTSLPKVTTFELHSFLKLLFANPATRWFRMYHSIGNPCIGWHLESMQKALVIIDFICVSSPCITEEVSSYIFNIFTNIPVSWVYQLLEARFDVHHSEGESGRSKPPLGEILPYQHFGCEIVEPHIRQEMHSTLTLFVILGKTDQWFAQYSTLTMVRPIKFYWRGTIPFRIHLSEGQRKQINMCKNHCKLQSPKSTETYVIENETNLAWLAIDIVWSCERYMSKRIAAAKVFSAPDFFSSFYLDFQICVWFEYLLISQFSFSS